MNENKLRHAWDSVQMTEFQKKHIWKQIKRKAEQPKPSFARKMGFTMQMASAMIIFVAIFFPALRMINIYQTNAKTKFPAELSETVQQEQYSNVLVLWQDGLWIPDCDYLRNCGVGTNFIISINHESKEAKLLTVSYKLRLLAVDNEKIKLSNPFVTAERGADTGTIALNKEYLEKQLNLTIDAVIVANDDSMSFLVDALGGVEVEISSEELSWLKRNSAHSRYEELKAKKSLITRAGKQEILGSTALKWLQSPLIGFETETGYIERTYEMMEAIVKKLCLLESEEMLTDWMEDRIEAQWLAVDTDIEALTQMLYLNGEGNYGGSYNLQDSPYVYENNNDDYYWGFYVEDWQGWLEDIATFIYGEPLGTEAEKAEILSETYNKYFVTK